MILRSLPIVATPYVADDRFLEMIQCNKSAWMSHVWNVTHDLFICDLFMLCRWSLATTQYEWVTSGMWLIQMSFIHMWLIHMLQMIRCNNSVSLFGYEWVMSEMWLIHVRFIHMWLIHMVQMMRCNNSVCLVWYEWVTSRIRLIPVRFIHMWLIHMLQMMRCNNSVWGGYD